MNKYIRNNLKPFFKKIRPFAVPAVLLIILFCSIILLANALIQKPSIQKYLIKELSDISGFDIHTREIKLNLWKGIGIFVNGLNAGSRSGPEKISASKVRIIFAAGELLKGRIVPVRLYLLEPRVETEIKDARHPEKPDRSPATEGLPLIWFDGLKSVSVEKGLFHIKNRHVRLKDVNLDIRRKDLAPIKLALHSRGMAELRGREVPFNLRGSVFLPPEGSGFPFIDLTLKTDEAPLKLLPWPEIIDLKKGTFDSDLKIKGNPGKAVAVGGKVFVKSPLFLLRESGLEKDYSLANITLDFQSVIEGSQIDITSLRFTTPDVSLALSLRLDLEEKDNPSLELNIKSPFMPLHTFKNIFPSPLLSSWFEDELFPLLNRGDIRVELFSLKGKSDQFGKLYLPENHSTLTLNLELKGLRAFENSVGEPFKDIAAKVILKHGRLRVSGLTSNFGNSSIKDASLDIEKIYRDKPSFTASLEGSFDLNDLLQKREIGLIPFEVRRHLNKVESISGRIDGKADFNYEYKMEFPRIKNGEFFLRNCLVKQKGLLLPLKLDKAEIKIDKDGQNPVNAEGSWGNSSFKINGALGNNEDGNFLSWADISTKIDINQAGPLFYQIDNLPLKFKGLTSCRMSVINEKDDWSCRGSIDLEGMILETEDFSIIPPGDRDRIVFNLNFRPGERIYLKNLTGEFGGSLLKISGLYKLKDKQGFDFNISFPKLSLEDIGGRSGRDNIPLKGSLNGSLRVEASRQDLRTARVTGQVKGKNVSFDMNRLPSLVNDCDFQLTFSGKNVFINRLNMKTGKSALNIKGALEAWPSLKGKVEVNSEFIDIVDFLPPEDDVLTIEKKPAAGGEYMKTGELRLKLDLRHGEWKKIKWGPLIADLEFKKGNLYIRKANVFLDHGGIMVTGHVGKKEKPPMLFSSHIRLYDQPIDDILEILEIENKYMQGNLTTEAFLFTSGNNKKDLIPGLTGSIDILITKGAIKKADILIRVLDFMSLQKIFKRSPPNLSREGFYFEKIEGHAAIDNGIIDTKTLTLKSPIFNAVAAGKLYLPYQIIDVTLGTQPLETVDILITKIPILGYALTGKEKSFLTYYFNIEGPLKDPEVDYIPFENISRGIGGTLKRLFLTPSRIYNDITKP